MDEHILFINDDGDFALAKNADVLRISILGYDSKPITPEEAESIKKSMSLHGKEKLIYNGEKVTLKANKEKK